MQNRIPLHQHWMKAFGWSTEVRLPPTSQAVLRSFESEHGEHVDQDIDSWIGVIECIRHRVCFTWLKSIRYDSQKLTDTLRSTVREMP